MAAPTFVQSARNESTSGPAITVSLAGASTVGNLLVMPFAIATGISVTTPAGWTREVNGESTVFFDNYLFWKVSTGETSVVVATGDASSSHTIRWAIGEYALTDATVEYTHTSNVQSPAPGAATGPTISYGAGPRVILGVCFDEIGHDAPDTPGVTGGATLRAVGSTSKIYLSDELVDTVAGTAQWNYTFTQVANCLSIAVTFVAGSGSTTPGVWLDFDRDGFTDAAATSEDGYLSMEFPEGGSTSVSDNITPDVISIDVTQGATAEVTGGSGTDTCTIIVANTDRKYTPDYTSSPIYGKCRPGTPVWIGVNEDGTLSGSGLTVYGVFAGRVREITPIAAGGTAASPTAEILCDGILPTYQRSPVRFTDSLTRSQYDYRVAVLDAIGEDAARRDLDTEPDTLPLSSADSTDALSVLDALNGANGTRHFIAADQDKDVWYKYTTRNRQYKFGAAADETIDAGSDHLTSIDGWRYNNDSLINHQRASIDPVNFPFAIAQVWTYDNVPFTLVSANKTIWADFDDYVRGPALVVTATGTAVTSTLTSFGRSAKIELSATNATITNIRITGQQVIREQGVALTADDLTSQGTYGLYAGSDLSSELIGSSASAQGIVDHLVYRRGSRPLKRPAISISNWFPEMFSLRPYDQIAATIAAVSASAVKFEIVGRTLHCDFAASASAVLWTGTFQLAESRIQGTQQWFTLNTSLLDGPDLLGY